MLHRKSTFKEVEFSILKELTSEELERPTQYSSVLDEIGFSESDVFIYRDENLKKNSNYIYKIECFWVSTGPEPTEATAADYLAAIPTGSIAYRFIV